jgi:hypothetical protein
MNKDVEFVPGRSGNTCPFHNLQTIPAQISEVCGRLRTLRASASPVRCSTNTTGTRNALIRSTFQTYNSGHRGQVYGKPTYCQCALYPGATFCGGPAAQKWRPSLSQRLVTAAGLAAVENIDVESAFSWRWTIVHDRETVSQCA